MSWKFTSLDPKWDRSKFDCGEAALNSYLKGQISQDFKRKANVPYLAVNPKAEVVGFYTLSTSSVDFVNFPPKLKKLIAPYPVSVARIGRLAVDNSMKGKGLGRELLFHAIDKVTDLSQHIGIRALIVDAKNTNAENFYKKYGFDYLQTQGLRRSLFLIV